MVRTILLEYLDLGEYVCMAGEIDPGEEGREVSALLDGEQLQSPTAAGVAVEAMSYSQVGGMRM